MAAEDRATFKCNICLKSCFKICLWCFFCYMLLFELAKGFWNFNASDLLAWGTCPERSSNNIIIVSFSKLTSHITMGYSRKIPNTGSWGYTFLIWPLQFHPWKFYKTVLHPLEIPRWNIKTHGISTWVFVEHNWKLHFFLKWSLNFSLVHPSFNICICFLKVGSLIFSETWHGVTSLYLVICERAGFFWENPHWPKVTKSGQKWSKHRVFGLFKENQVIIFVSNWCKTKVVMVF